MSPKKKNIDPIMVDLPERRLPSSSAIDIVTSFVVMMENASNRESVKYGRVPLHRHPLAVWVAKLHRRPIEPNDELAVYTHHVKGPDLGSIHTLSFIEFIDIPKLIDTQDKPLPVPIGLIIGTSAHLTMAERSIVWLTMTDATDGADPTYDIRTYNARSKSVSPYPPVLFDHLKQRISSVDHNSNVQG